ncbi:MAG: translation initiation factor IF-6 [Candidatus Bathyarchaeia archaeon]
MPINSFNILGNPNIGVFLITTDTYLIAPIILTERKASWLAKNLGVRDFLRLKICGSKLLGIFIAANSKGIAIPHLAQEDEIKELQDLKVEVRTISGQITALGNCVLVNDKGGVVDHRFPRRTIQEIEDALGVNLVPGTIAGLPFVGSLAVATNNGVLAHPKITEEEERLLKEALKVPVHRGTVINGVPYIKVGLIANRFGAIVGRGTTGPELMAIGKSLSIS